MVTPGHRGLNWSPRRCLRTRSRNLQPSSRQPASPLCPVPQQDLAARRGEEGRGGGEALLQLLGALLCICSFHPAWSRDIAQAHIPRPEADGATRSFSGRLTKGGLKEGLPLEAVPREALRPDDAQAFCKS